MKHNEITKLTPIQMENFENIFNVYQDLNGMYFYNLINNITIPDDLPINLFNSYIVKYGDTWPFISYKTLNSPNMWWMILLANKIDNPLLPIEPGTELKIPKEEVVKEILSQIAK